MSDREEHRKTRLSHLLGVVLAPYRQRRYLTAHIIFVVVTLLLAMVPLFNLLGYEFSLVIAVLAAVVIGPVTIGGLKAPEPSPTDTGADTATEEPGPHDPSTDRDVGPIDTWFRLLLLNLGLLVLPLLLISFNALRVRNCDYVGGLAAFIALPVVSTAWTTLVAMILGALFPRRWQANVAYFFLLLLSAAGTLAYLALEPPIVAVNPWIGYFAGSLYDEALAIPLPLIWYRAVQIALMAAVLTGLEVTWHVRRRERIPAGLRAVCAAAVVLVVVGHAHHQKLGYTMTRAGIQKALGGVYETEHFTIYHSTAGDWPRRIERIAEDHEFRYWQMARFFGNEPEGQHVVSYVYPDRETKGRLMGARRTLVAKLWLGEMHITYKGYGDDLLTHELSHLFTEPFGSGPLSLSTTMGVLPNMGLVEGVASAAQWTGRELTPHGWAAALHRLDLAPDVAAVLSASGFWSRQSRTVYTMMGSFVRWLIDTRGIDKFKEAYAHGELEATYGESLESLVAEWRGFLDGIELTESDLALAEYRFDRPSIFGKVCARNIAERKRVAGELSAAGRDREAIVAMEDVVKLDPGNPAHAHDLVKLLIKAEQLDRARDLTAELLDREGIGAVRRNQLRQLLGDIYWRSGKLETAAGIYAETLADIGLPPEVRRQLAVKKYGLEHPAVRQSLHDYFFEEGGHAEKLALLFSARVSNPGDPVIAYLVGLRLSAIHRYADAVEHLDAAVSQPLPGVDVSQRARFLLAEALYFVDRLDDSEGYFTTLSESARLDGQRARADEWLLRIEWKRGRKGTKTAVQRPAPTTPSRGHPVLGVALSPRSAHEPQASTTSQDRPYKGWLE